MIIKQRLKQNWLYLIDFLVGVNYNDRVIKYICGCGEMADAQGSGPCES